MFRARGAATRVRDAVLLGWDAVQVADGRVVGAGTDLLLLDAAGRIRADYQFVT